MSGPPWPCRHKEAPLPPVGLPSNRRDIGILGMVIKRSQGQINLVPAPCTFLLGFDGCGAVLRTLIDHRAFFLCTGFIRSFARRLHPVRLEHR